MTLVAPTPPAASGFIDFLTRLEYGKLLDEADDALVNLLRELVKAADRGAKPKGGLTLKINFDYDEDGLLSVKGDLAVTKPRYPRRNTILFCNAQGEIIGTAPKQLSIFAEHGTEVSPEAVAVAPQQAAPVAVAMAQTAPVAVAMAQAAPVAVATVAVATAPADLPPNEGPVSFAVEETAGSNPVRSDDVAVEPVPRAMRVVV